LEDLGMLYKMYAETSVRDGFVIRDEEYYMTVWKTFMQEAVNGAVCRPIDCGSGWGSGGGDIFIYVRWAWILCVRHVAQCSP
jgi:peptidoglycan pentaglycine glycine transferase (the first glycine)